jgi:aminoglycoside phosphotransferase (APT) family kinase protein
MAQKSAVADLLKLLQLLVVGPFFFFAILLDRYFFKRLNPFLGLVPRTVPEVFQPPRRIFDLVRASPVASDNAINGAETDNGITTAHRLIPADAVFVSCEAGGGAAAEPDKSVVRCDVTFTSRSSGTAAPQTARLFVKLPTARPYAVAFKTLISTFSAQTKEIAFHSVVLPALDRISRATTAAATTPSSAKRPPPLLTQGLCTANVAVAKWSRVFERSVLVTEYLDCEKEFEVLPDWQGVTLAQHQQMIDSISHLHALTWRAGEQPSRPDVARLLRDNFPERGGAEWLDVVLALYLSSEPPCAQRIWAAVMQRLASEPSTLSHADFRPGNMLFSKKDRATPAGVRVLDWEANSVTVYLWDVIYSTILGLTPDERRANERAIIKRYLDNLTAVHGLPRDAAGIPSLDSAMAVYPVMQVVLLYFSWVLTKFGGVGRVQGNSASDMRAWSHKVTTAVAEALNDEARLAAQLGVDPALVVEFREAHYAKRALDCTSQ